MMISVERIWFEDAKNFAEMKDGRIVGKPLSWFPNLSKGTHEQLEKYELWHEEAWIHWKI